MRRHCSLYLLIYPSQLTNHFIVLAADEEFEDLCFEYGLEMEMGNGVEMSMNRLDADGNAINMEQTTVYKIEVPANRYDLLCLEGIATALKSYLGTGAQPQYSLTTPAKMERVTVKAATKDVRRYAVACILRNVKFNDQSYNSFIDLQDKLHQNICRRRTLGSMGTHDYDKVQGPITYEALPPKDIVFRALKQQKEMNCVELFDVLRNDQMLKKYLHIIEGMPRYPVFYDAKRTVLSLPPIINSDATKISHSTKNVFIEVTGTDLTKCKICLTILAAQFSEHCQGDSKYKIEPVEVVYEGEGGKKLVEPTLTPDQFEVQMQSTCKLLGVELTADQMNKAAIRMGLKPVAPSKPAKAVKYEVSALRPDILHACDVAEEIGIGYGFNNIPMVYPPTNTVGAFIPENKFTDLLRHELAQAGYIETLTCALLSLKENYTFLGSETDLSEAITLSNPKTIEYEMVRTSLIPGLLKTLQSNQNERLPQRLFEISDTAKQDKSCDTGAKNHRKICVMQLNTQASFEVIHGALGLLMTKIGAQIYNRRGEVASKAFSLEQHKDGEDNKYFP